MGATVVESQAGVGPDGDQDLARTNQGRLSVRRGVKLSLKIKVIPEYVLRYLAQQS